MVKRAIRLKHTYIYNDKGNEVEHNFYNSNGSLDMKYAYIYDEVGNKIEENRYSSKGELLQKYTFKYEVFDHTVSNNWINQISFNNGIPNYITKREIIYY